MFYVITNGFLYYWRERQFKMSKKKKQMEADIVSQGSSAAVHLAKDSWGVTTLPRGPEHRILK